jgi:esterase/lipase superfamily enzyme
MRRRATLVALAIASLLSACATTKPAPVAPPSWDGLEQSLRAEAARSGHELAVPGEAGELPDIDAILSRLQATRHDAALDGDAALLSCIDDRSAAIEQLRAAPPAGGDPEARRQATWAAEAAAWEARRLADGIYVCATGWQDPSLTTRGDEADEVRWTEVSVLYGTDRIRTGEAPTERRYGSLPRCPARADGSLPYPDGDTACFDRGSAVVTIPDHHQPGELEGMGIFRTRFVRDPSQHVTLESVNQLSAVAFARKLQRRVGDSKDKQLFVFVHGYNVPFGEALRRTAQIAHDLPFDGAAVAWTWASRGSLPGYWDDERHVEATVPHLRLFLEELARDSGATSIHVIAHSMGNRAMTAALAEIARRDGPRFSQVVLAAPDIDADVYRDELAPLLREQAERVTLYASSNDLALQASKLVHGGRRAGDAGTEPPLAEGVDTVDASAADTTFLGHTYIADKPSVLQDLRHLLQGLAPGEQRPWLARREGWWRFDP